MHGGGIGIEQGMKSLAPKLGEASNYLFNFLESALFGYLLIFFLCLFPLLVHTVHSIYGSREILSICWRPIALVLFVNFDVRRFLLLLPVFSIHVFDVLFKLGV